MCEGCTFSFSDNLRAHGVRCAYTILHRRLAAKNDRSLDDPDLEAQCRHFHKHLDALKSSTPPEIHWKLRSFWIQEGVFLEPDDPKYQVWDATTKKYKRFYLGRYRTEDELRKMQIIMAKIQCEEEGNNGCPCKVNKEESEAREGGGKKKNKHKKKKAATKKRRRERKKNEEELSAKTLDDLKLKIGFDRFPLKIKDIFEMLDIETAVNLSRVIAEVNEKPYEANMVLREHISPSCWLTGNCEKEDPETNEVIEHFSLGRYRPLKEYRLLTYAASALLEYWDSVRNTGSDTKATHEGGCGGMNEWLKGTSAEIKGKKNIVDAKGKAFSGNNTEDLLVSTLANLNLVPNGRLNLAGLPTKIQTAFEAISVETALRLVTAISELHNKKGADIDYILEKHIAPDCRLTGKCPTRDPETGEILERFCLGEYRNLEEFKRIVNALQAFVEHWTGPSMKSKILRPINDAVIACSESGEADSKTASKNCEKKGNVGFTVKEKGEVEQKSDQQKLAKALEVLRKHPSHRSRYGNEIPEKVLNALNALEPDTAYELVTVITETLNQPTRSARQVYIEEELVPAAVNSDFPYPCKTDPITGEITERYSLGKYRSEEEVLKILQIFTAFNESPERDDEPAHMSVEDYFKY